MNNYKIEEFKENFGNIWLWCISEGYREVPNAEDICFVKEGKITNFIPELNRSKEELLCCIHKSREKYDYIYLVINNSSKRSKLEKFLPDYCGIICFSNSFGLGNTTQIFRKPKSDL